MNAFAKPGLAEEKLPPVSTADNGKVLGVNNGVWDKVAASGGSDLPEVTADDKDKYLHTNASTGDLEWSAVSGGGGGALRVVLTTEDEESFETDKTWQEIYDAVTTGAGAFAIVDFGQSVTLCSIVNISSNEGYRASVVGFIVHGQSTVSTFGIELSAETANSILIGGGK